jgi:hypothetical protein
MINITFPNRKDCNCYDYIPLTNSDIGDKWIRTNLGPDEILVYVEGPTLQTIIPSYNGCHSYSTIFTAQHTSIGEFNGNKYRIKVVWLRSKYTSINNIDKSFPPIQYGILLDEEFSLKDYIYIQNITINNSQTESIPVQYKYRWTAIKPNYILQQPLPLMVANRGILIFHPNNHFYH